jgi:hypothetical protein
MPESTSKQPPKRTVLSVPPPKVPLTALVDPGTWTLMDPHTFVGPRQPAPPLEVEPLRPDPGARERAPVVTNPFAVMGAPASAFAGGLGALLDRPGDLGSAGRAALERLQTDPYARSVSELTSPSQEAAARGVDLGTIPGLVADLGLDPMNLAGDPFTDIGKVGLAAAAATPRAIRLARGLAKPTTEKAMAAFARRFPRMAKALGKTGEEVALRGAGSPRHAFDRLVQDVYDRTLAKTGSSTRPLTGEAFVGKQGGTGYMAGQYANQTGKTWKVSPAEFSPAKIREFLEHHAEKFASDPEAVLGTWLDPDTGNYFLDVSQKHETPRQAVVAAGRQPQPRTGPNAVSRPMIQEEVPMIVGGRKIMRTVEREGPWPMPQLSVYDLSKSVDEPGAFIPVGNLREFLQTPEFQSRLDQMYQKGLDVMGGKGWWDLHGSTLERVYGKKRLEPVAALLATTSSGSPPVENARTASEYIRRLIKNEPLIQPEFRIPETAVGWHPDPELGHYGGPGTQLPKEQTRLGNLKKVAEGRFGELSADKVNDMYHALMGDPDVGVFDRHWAKIAEAPERGIYAESGPNVLQGSMMKPEDVEAGKVGKVGSYALIENRVRDAAEAAGVPLSHYSAVVWEGIRDTIAKEGQLFGTKYDAGKIPEIRGGFPSIVDKLIAQKAKIWGITVKEFERRLRRGDAELLAAILATPVGYAAYQRMQGAVGEPPPAPPVQY